MITTKPLRILLTNDDGIEAPGIFALKLALDAAGHAVTVCAPNRPRSASGHAITLHKPLRLHPVTLRDGAPAFSTSGTPADCVMVGLIEVMQNAVDLVVSGINHGPNLGWDLTYSGTVAAAIEGVISGFPAVAVSLASYDQDICWEPVARYVAQTLIPAVAAHGLPPATLLNVNAPNLPDAELKGVRLTAQGEITYTDRLEKRLDPSGRPYYWLGGKVAPKTAAPGTDVEAIGEGCISVTPVHLDLTSHALLRDLRDWNIEK